MKRGYKFALITLFLFVLLTAGFFIIRNLLWNQAYQRISSMILPQPKKAEQITNILPIPLHWTKYRNEEFGVELSHDPSTVVSKATIIYDHGNNARNLRLTVHKKDALPGMDELMTLHVSAEKDWATQKNTDSNIGWLPPKIVLNALNSQSRENLLDTIPAIETNYQQYYTVTAIHNRRKYSLSFTIKGKGVYGEPLDTLKNNMTNEQNMMLSSFRFLPSPSSVK